MFHKTFTSFVSAKQLHNILEHSTTLAKIVQHCTHLYITIFNFYKTLHKQNTKNNKTKHNTTHKKEKKHNKAQNKTQSKLVTQTSHHCTTLYTNLQ